MGTLPFPIWLVSVLLLSLSTLIWLLYRTRRKSVVWLWDLSKAATLDESSIKTPPITFKLIGQIPTKIYKGDSTAVTVRTLSGELSNGHAQKTGDMTKPLDVPESTLVGVVLKQAGFNVGGDARQEQVLTSLRGNLRFEWILAPKDVGNHQISLSAYWVDEQGYKVPIDTQIYHIKVTEIWGLSSRQWRYLSLLFALIAFLTPTIISIVELMNP